MNLYGESGNVKALKLQLEQQGVKVKIHFLSITDSLDFSKYDFVYMGMGTEENQVLVLKHLLPYKKQIQKVIQEGTYFLVTGNSLELFGKNIHSDKKRKALGIFHYETKHETFRIVGETLADSTVIHKPILGFQNRFGVMLNVKEESLFTMRHGTGYAPNIEKEGIHKFNFFGTYLIGPILIRNPELLKYIVKQLIMSKDKNYKLKPFHLTLENKAYNTFTKKYQTKN